MADDQSQATNLRPQATGPQPVAPTGGPKEVEPASAKATAGEAGAEVVVEMLTEPELEKKPELAGYIEKVEKAAELTTPITDDYTGQVLLKPSQPQDVTVTLPLTEDQVVVGLHQQVWQSVRWLAEWCVRQIKVLHGKVRYKEGTRQ